MRRVFENSVKTAHSTSIARPCDGGVSELFRSCFCALAMFSRQRRENIASVPAGLLAPWAKRTASRSAKADPPKCAPCGRGPPGVPAGLFSPYGLKTHGLQVRFAHPSKCALTSFARQRRANPASVPAGLLARWAKRTASRFASLTLRTSPRAGKARPGFRMAYFRPLGSKRTCSRSAKADPPNFAPRGQSPPGVPAGFQVRTGWARVLVRRGC